MKRNLIATLLIAASATLAAPAFASGYGPAPHYRPDTGAPASQRGVSAQTFAAEEAAQGRGDFGNTERTAQIHRGQVSASASSQVAQ